MAGITAVRPESDEDGLVLIAHYPLDNSASDITGNNGDMELLNIPFEDGGIYSDGTYFYDDENPNHAQTPIIEYFNFASFVVDFEFKIVASERQPIIIAGRTGRWIGLVINHDGYAQLLHNNSLVDSSQIPIEPGRWYTAKISYAEGVGSIYIDGELGASDEFSIDPVRRRAEFMTTNFSNGTALRGWLRNLRIYTIPSAEELPPRVSAQVVAGGRYAGEEGQPALISNLDWEYQWDTSNALGLDNLGRLYFWSKGYGIRRIETDGTLSTFLGRTTIRDIDDFVVKEDVVYALSGFSVYSVDANTGAVMVDYQFAIPPDMQNEFRGYPRLTVDAQGNLYQSRYYRIFKLDINSGETTHIAGNGGQILPESNENIPALEATMTPLDIVIHPSNKALLFLDAQHRQIGRIDLSTGIMNSMTTKLEEWIEDRWSMRSLDLLPDGNILFTAGNHVYRLSAATGEIQIVAGDGERESLGGDGGPARHTGITPFGVLVTASGDYYFNTYPTDESVERIRFVETERDVVRTVAGLPGRLGCASPLDSRLVNLDEVAIDDNGILYVLADNAVLAIDVELGLIYSVAGVYGAAGDSPDGVLAHGNPIRVWNDTASNLTVAPDGTLFFYEFGRLRSVDRESGLLGTLAEGFYRTIAHDGNGHIYAVREHGVSNPIDIVKISDTTGSITTVLKGGTGEPRTGQSAEGKNFWNKITDLAIDSIGNIYLGISIQADGDELPSGVYRVDSQSKVVSRVFNLEDAPEVEHFWWPSLALDENRNLIYVNSVEAQDNWSIVQVDLSSGNLEWFRHSRSQDIAVSRDGVPYFLNRAFSEPNPYYAVYRLSYAPLYDSGVIPDDIEAGANAGRSVANVGNWLAIGVPNSDSAAVGRGEVLVYQDNDCRPILRDRLSAPEDTTANQFGNKLAFVGDSLVVGASVDAAVSLKARSSPEADREFRLGRYVLDDRHWRFDRDLSGLLPPAGSSAPEGLTAYGDSFAVGSPGANGGLGVVTLFDDNDIEHPVTVEPPVSGTTGFGTSLALTGDHLAVGGVSLAGGITAVFGKKGFLVTPLGTVISPRNNLGFGTALAMNDQGLYVGAPHPDGGRVFGYKLASLGLTDMLADPDDPANPSFGDALAIENDTLVVGAPEAAVPNAQRAGSTPQNGKIGGLVGVFDIKDELGNLIPASPLFTLYARQEAAYGDAVAISDGRIVIGAPETDDGRGSFEVVSQIVDAADLSGLWFDPKQDGEGFNVLVADAGMVVFFYGYDSDGNRLWLVSDTFSGEFGFGEDIHVPIYKALAGDFAGPVPSSEALIKYGLLSMSFGSTRSATFTINGFDGNKISRNTFLADTGANAAAYSGLWYDPDKDGEGYNVISGAPGTVIYYYGSTQEGERLWLISELLSNEIGDGTALQGTMYEAEGGDFYHPAPSATAIRNWGTLEARFDDCAEGRFILSGSDGSKTSDVVKLAGVVGAECH